MPFHTTQQYFATATKTEDLCPYGCITKEAAGANGTQELKVDEELCTDCGACALACPGKFEYARAFTRYAPAPRIAVHGPLVGSMGGSGGVIVMDDSVNMVEALANINAFYSHESCGQEGKGAPAPSRRKTLDISPSTFTKVDGSSSCRPSLFELALPC